MLSANQSLYNEDYTFYNYIYMKCPEKANSIKIESRLVWEMAK
jgi:hypothetical protein